MKVVLHSLIIFFCFSLNSALAYCNYHIEEKIIYTGYIFINAKANSENSDINFDKEFYIKNSNGNTIGRIEKNFYGDHDIIDNNRNIEGRIKKNFYGGYDITDKDWNKLRELSLHY